MPGGAATRSDCSNTELALVRSLTRSAWKANLTFEVGAEELNGIADRSVWRFVSMPSSIC